MLLCFVSLSSHSNQHDRYRWEVDGISITTFSASHTWKAIMVREDTKECSSIIWFADHIPSLALHIWVVHLDRLPTRSWIASWALLMNNFAFSVIYTTKTGTIYSWDAPLSSDELVNWICIVLMFLNLSLWIWDLFFNFHGNLGQVPHFWISC